MAKNDSKSAPKYTQPEEREQALERALSALDKQFGKGTVMRLGEQSKMNIEVISTGCLELDMALGVGGIPRGRIIEI
ncbi:MAG: DNA recombination/repair protein RecA, partial [Christensenellales bacterium]